MLTLLMFAGMFSFRPNYSLIPFESMVSPVGFKGGVKLKKGDRLAVRIRKNKETGIHIGEIKYQGVLIGLLPLPVANWWWRMEALSVFPKLVVEKTSDLDKPIFKILAEIPEQLD